jgi:hypothetical protein
VEVVVHLTLLLMDEVVMVQPVEAVVHIAHQVVQVHLLMFIIKDLLALGHWDLTVVLAYMEYYLMQILQVVEVAAWVLLVALLTHLIMVTVVQD